MRRSCCHLFVQTLVLNYILQITLVIIILPTFINMGTLTEARPQGRKNRLRQTPVHYKYNNNNFKSKSQSKTRNILDSAIFKGKKGDIISFPSIRTENIKSPDISKQQFLQLISPPEDKSSSSMNDHLRGGGSRRRRLFCRAGIGFHLEIENDGRIVGRHTSTKQGLLQIFSVDVGVVGIKGVESKRYLCMDHKGRVTGKKRWGPECQFRETVEENNYNTYSSLSKAKRSRSKKPLYLALTKRGVPKRGKKVPRSPNHKTTHWLPRQP